MQRDENLRTKFNDESHCSTQKKCMCNINRHFFSNHFDSSSIRIKTINTRISHFDTRTSHSDTRISHYDMRIFFALILWSYQLCLYVMLRYSWDLQSRFRLRSRSLVYRIECDSFEFNNDLHHHSRAIHFNQASRDQ